MFRVGDRVRIFASHFPERSKWFGFEARVIEGFSRDISDVQLKTPLEAIGKRPDGAPFPRFYWHTDCLELVLTAPPKFASVEEADAWLNAHS